MAAASSPARRVSAAALGFQRSPGGSLGGQTARASLAEHFAVAGSLGIAKRRRGGSSRGGSAACARCLRQVRSFAAGRRRILAAIVLGQNACTLHPSMRVYGRLLMRMYSKAPLSLWRRVFRRICMAAWADACTAYGPQAHRSGKMGDFAAESTTEVPQRYTATERKVRLERGQSIVARLHCRNCARTSHPKRVVFAILSLSPSGSWMHS